MRNIVLVSILLLPRLSIISQSRCDYDYVIDNFSNIQDMPYICDRIDDIPWSPGCGDSIFWNALAYGEDIIPCLLDGLDDTVSSFAYVPNFGGKYTVGDISLVALNNLVWGIPVLDLAEDPGNPEPRNGYWSYWDYVRRNIENRVKFRLRVISWYEKNREHLVWIESGVIRGCECGTLQNPAEGHFEIKSPAHNTK